ncbi:MAG: tetratricopeptide repeat protein [Ktedonobacterales bacterium]
MSIDGSILSQLGLIALNEGNLDDAEHYFRRSLAIREEVQDKPSEGADLGYLARIALAREIFEGAEQLLRKSLQIAKDVGGKQGEGIVYS